MKLCRLWSQDPVDECFTVELRVSSRWQCPQQYLEKYKPKAQERLKGGSLGADWSPEWTPHFSFLGSKNRENGLCQYTLAEDESDPEVIWIEGMLWVIVTLTEFYHLQDFPFDQQDLNINMCIDNALSMVAPQETWANV